ncbi:MAG: deoxyribose-phosphate aldolase [Thermoanaerobaculales bacterium]|jgi:deoxyribose-phosphate aldolase|nr:deoxyribose-phosphate aldolase [Thermoanaerobaculales bacterium]
MNQRRELVEEVTRQVLAVLAAGGADLGLDNAREAVANGAARLGYSGNGADVPAGLERYIDHTVLKPDVPPDQIDRLCDEAMQYHFAAVCINPVWVRRAAQRVRGSKVKVASVVGFPLGANVPEIKAMEARRAIRDGAREIDMVINIGALKGGDHDLVRRDIAGVSDACREVGALNKVIIEAAYLTDEEKVIACRLAQLARADFVKTSTGFGPGGATVFDVALMRETVGEKMGVKAAGGIGSADDARAMITAGANRIGASAGIRIVTGDEGGSGESY